jgi:hypothetical protein
MDPLPEPAWEDEEKRRLPPLRWFAQCAGAFAAVALVGGLLIAPGGLVERIGGFAPASALSLPRADLEGGQFYNQDWVNPDTGMPYADQVDAQSSDYASAEPALYYDDGSDEPLEGEVSRVSRTHFESAAIGEDYSFEPAYTADEDPPAYDDKAAYDPANDAYEPPSDEEDYDGLRSGA